jgi:hypothetical protein
MYKKKYIETLQEANFNNSETDRLLKKRNAKSCCGLVASKICKFIALNPDKEDFFLNICNDQAKTYYKKVRASFLTKLIANDVKVEKKLNSKKIVFSDIHRDKIIDAVKRTAQKNIKVYQILDPQGNMHKTTEGLEKFCNDNNLCARNLLNVLKGKSKHHHGWQAAESIFQSKKTITVYNLISPDGTRYETTKGLSDFCKNHGLSYDKMLMVTKNRRPHHKGWKFCEGYEIIPKLD